MRAYDFINEAFLAEAPGPDLNNPSDVKDWIERYKRIIDTSDFVGERNSARSMLNKLLAELGRKPEPEQPEQPAGPKSSGTSMAADAFKVIFFGHYYDPEAGKRGSDKVWGWGVQGDYIYQFWGANGKTPQVKRMPNTEENRAKTNKTAGQKEQKGYERQSAADHAKWIEQVLSKAPKFDGE